MSDSDYSFGFGKDKIELNKLKHDGLWRLNLNNNNNLLGCHSTHNFASLVDGEEEAKLQRTMAKAKQKQTTTSAAVAAATATTTTTAAATTTTATPISTATTIAATTGAVGAVAVTPTYVAHIEDEGGGGDEEGADDEDGDCAAAAVDTSDKLNGICVGGAAYTLTALPPLNCTAAAAAAVAAAAAASALSPTDAAIGGLSSSRTSMNNSTENLSYASDNYYGDDLILLDDDDDVEAEEISLNSDDCVYAYRGDAADFDMAALDASTGRGGRNLDFGLVRDDETDFLEMDFEPDPSSELEFAASAQEAAAHANLLLMQRDYSQLQAAAAAAGGGGNGGGGRHMATPTQGRQLYSSPIEDLPAPQEALQRLSKKFARISLNLDQIKADADTGSDLDVDELFTGSKEDEDFVDNTVTDGITTLAHSLPNTLVYSGFNRSTSVPSEHTHVTDEEESRSNCKLTGAKPKRLSTLSTSSSMVSTGKSCASSSSKSRRSQPSFDERCFSCTDFRAVSSNQQMQQQQQQQPDVAPMLVAAAAVVAASAALQQQQQAANSTQFDLSSGEETCLDCLEKEFLANTIGKAMDLTSCAKCRRYLGGRGSSLSLYARAEQTRCRSGSPGYLDEFGGLFSWHTSMPGGVGTGGDLGHYNQRFISCDNNFGSVQLLKQSFSTEPPLVVRLSTAQLSEEHLVQALDKLHISYNASLLQSYFNQPQRQEVGDLRRLLLHVSKQQCNHHKLKKLIELISQQQLNVQFKRSNAAGASAALVPLKVIDILAAWKRHPDLSVLRQLDARFHRANVLGKIGHIVRQAQQQQQQAATSSASAAASPLISSTRLALPELIMIPQYYASGELTLTRKC